MSKDKLPVLSVDDRIKQVDGFGNQEKAKACLEQIQNFASFKTHADVAKAFHGLSYLLLHNLIDPKVAEVHRKIVDNYAHYMWKYLEVDFPDETLKAMDDKWDRLMKAVQQVVTPEQWTQIKGMIGGTSVQE